MISKWGSVIAEMISGYGKSLCWKNEFKGWVGQTTPQSFQKWFWEGDQSNPQSVGVMLLSTALGGHGIDGMCLSRRHDPSLSDQRDMKVGKGTCESCLILGNDDLGPVLALSSLQFLCCALFLCSIVRCCFFSFRSFSLLNCGYHCCSCHGCLHVPADIRFDCYCCGLLLPSNLTLAELLPFSPCICFFQWNHSSSWVSFSILFYNASRRVMLRCCISHLPETCRPHEQYGKLRSESKRRESRFNLQIVWHFDHSKAGWLL